MKTEAVRRAFNVWRRKIQYDTELDYRKIRTAKDRFVSDQILIESMIELRLTAKETRDSEAFVAFYIKTTRTLPIYAEKLIQDI